MTQKLYPRRQNSVWPLRAATRPYFAVFAGFYGHPEGSGWVECSHTLTEWHWCGHSLTDAIALLNTYQQRPHDFCGITSRRET